MQVVFILVVCRFFMESDIKRRISVQKYLTRSQSEYKPDSDNMYQIIQSFTDYVPIYPTKDPYLSVQGPSTITNNQVFQKAPADNKKHKTPKCRVHQTISAQYKTHISANTSLSQQKKPLLDLWKRAKIRSLTSALQYNYELCTFWLLARVCH